MTERTDFLSLRACLGLPLAQALAFCRARGEEPQIIYTGERAAREDLTPRVIAVRGQTLVVSLFRDGDPGEGEA